MDRNATENKVSRCNTYQNKAFRVAVGDPFITRRISNSLRTFQDKAYYFLNTHDYIDILHSSANSNTGSKDWCTLTVGILPSGARITGQIPDLGEFYCSRVYTDCVASKNANDIRGLCRERWDLALHDEGSSVTWKDPYLREMYWKCVKEEGYENCIKYMAYRMAGEDFVEECQKNILTPRHAHPEDCMDVCKFGFAGKKSFPLKLKDGTFAFKSDWVEDPNRPGKPQRGHLNQTQANIVNWILSNSTPLHSRPIMNTRIPGNFGYCPKENIPFTSPDQSKTAYNCRKFANLFYSDPEIVWSTIAGPGYKVDQTSWDKFTSFIRSNEQLNQLDTPVLQELCNSLTLDVCQSSKGAIISELVNYFAHIDLYPTWVPQSLMTVYCSTPSIQCQ